MFFLICGSKNNIKMRIHLKLVKYIERFLFYMGGIITYVVIFLTVCFAVLIVAFVVMCFYPESSRLYYIDEMEMYIKTFPSKQYKTIVFSENKINDFSEEMDYIVVCKGDDYSTTIFFDPNNKYRIYTKGTNSIHGLHLKNYKLDTITYKDTLYYEYDANTRRYFLKHPFIELSFYISGIKEELSSKKRNDVGYKEIKPIE